MSIAHPPPGLRLRRNRLRLRRKAPNPADGADGDLYGVSCPSASACIAVGGVADAVVERYS
jgi:hypothetical protein